jgi:flagellar motor switch protein FliG
LQPAVRNDLVVRMLRLQDAAPEIEQLLEVQLEQDLLNAGGAEKKHASIAEVLNCLATTESRQILTFIANERPEDARALEKLLFGFEDLVRLPPAGLTVLVDRVATEKIVLALSGAAADIQAAVLAAMAPRARRMVEMELQSGSPASSEVSAARRELAATALKLASEKLIQLPQRDDASTADE